MQLAQQSSINATSDAYHAVTVGLYEAAIARLPNRLDVEYGSHCEQKLDLFFPEASPAHDLPIMLNIHGGGWTHGYKEWMGLNAPVVTSFPAVYATLSYRLAPAAKHPDQVNDCLAAIAWLKEFASSFGGNPDAIHIGGHSAGAHLAAMAALRPDLQQAQGLAPDTIKSCFCFSGIYDLRGAHNRPVVPGISPVPMLESAQDEAEASPLLAMREVATRFYVSWGAQEIDVFKQNGSAFAEALRESGNTVEVATADLDHFWIHLDQIRPESEWNKQLRQWMHQLQPDKETAK